MEFNRAIIIEAAEKLSAAGIESAEHDATALLEFATTTKQFDELITQRASRVPLQHITGTAYFRYIDLKVGKGVFIPRPETELLAQVGIDVLTELVKQRQSSEPNSESHCVKPVAFDLCSGSGAVAIAMATEVSNVTVHAVEKSVDATNWLLSNVEHTSEKLEANNSRVVVHALDATDVSLFTQWQNTADVVLSNPPYIPNQMIPRDPEVHAHDPHLALFGGESGLEIPIKVAQVAGTLLKDGGVFAMEHADVQGEHQNGGEVGLPQALREMTDEFGNALWEDVIDYSDYNNLPRYTVARRATRTQMIQPEVSEVTNSLDEEVER